MNPENTNQNPSLISIVIPIYNEEEILARFHNQLSAVLANLQDRFEIIYVDDGSTDGSPALLREIAVTDPRVEIIALSRNFGHQAALTAGLEMAEGDAVITMDGDGQHPPELINDFLNYFYQGYDLIQGKRLKGHEGLLKRWSSKWFYIFLNSLTQLDLEDGSADFRLMSRRFADALKAMPEYHRFLRGMVPWMGFKSSRMLITYAPNERIGGKSKFSLKKMLRLAADALFSFSLAPMKVAFLIGALYLAFSFIEFIIVIFYLLSNRGHLLEPGWVSLIFAIMLGNGLVLVTLSIFGYYIGYIFQQVKNRPVYIIKDIICRSSLEES